MQLDKERKTVVRRISTKEENRSLRTYAIQLFLSFIPIFVYEYGEYIDKQFIYTFPIVLACYIAFFVPTMLSKNTRYLILVIGVPVIFVLHKTMNANPFKNHAVLDIEKKIEERWCLSLRPMFGLMFVVSLLKTIAICTTISCRFIENFGFIRMTFYALKCIVNIVLRMILVFVLFSFLWLKVCPLIVHMNDTRTISANVIVPSRHNEDTLPLPRHYEKMVVYNIAIQNMSIPTNITGYNASIGDMQLPLCSRTFYRVRGEDVSLVCHIPPASSQIKLFDTGNTIKRSFIQEWKWEIKSVEINDSFPFFLSNDGHKISLSILTLSDEHFYKEISLWAIYKRVYDCGHTIRYLKIKFAYFFIHYQKELIIDVDLPRGHILYIRGMLFYSLENLILSEYRGYHDITSIANVTYCDITSACDDNDLQGCSPVVKYLFEMTQSTVYFRGIKLNTVQTFSNVTLNLVEIVSTSCICERAYGIHKITISRTLYNKESNREVIVDILLPYTFRTLPIGETSILSKKYHELRYDVEKNYEKMTNFICFWRYLEEEEAFYYFLRHYFEYLVSVFLYCDFLMIIIIFIKAYDKLAMSVFFRWKPEKREQIEVKGTFKYDFMIVNSDDDIDFCIDKLIPLLNTITKRIFFPSTGIIPGQFVYGSYLDAIRDSKHFIIVGTNSFENDYSLFDLIWINTIIPAISTGDRFAFYIQIDEFMPSYNFFLNKKVFHCGWNESTDDNNAKSKGLFTKVFNYYTRFVANIYRCLCQVYNTILRLID